MKEDQKKMLLYSALGLWAIGIATVLSFLMAGHFIVFPRPDSKFETALGELRNREAPANAWLAAHFIAEGCRCSSEVLSHLLARGPRTDIDEMIVYVGEELPEALRDSGFRVQRSDETQLFRRFGLEGVPLLAVASPSGELKYQGGYSQTRNSPNIEATLLAESMRGESPKSLPTFGCALSKELQDRVDPLGLKYN